MNRFSRKTIILIGLSMILLTGFTTYKLFGDDDDFEIAKSLEIYHSVLRDTRIYYVDDVDYAKLIHESTSELLSKLDPYTVYYPESQIEDYTFMTTGAYAGIGADIAVFENQLVITDVYDKSPARSAGLRVGDVILEIDSEIVTAENIYEIKENVKGEPDSKITLKIKRLNTTLENITLNREKIEIPDVTYFGQIRNGIGYIKLSGFRQNAANEFQAALKKMNDSVKLSGLVIDLRGNPGGLLIEAVKIVNLFVDKNQEIVSTRGRVAQWNSVFKTESNPLYPDLPLVVLVNRGSASASEIVSGALQDLDRAVIIGERTYGKGLVQATRDLVYNTKIKITTAKYYIPSGRCVQALDYTHRNPDGSVGKVPDTLITAYKTANGRTVYDGGGIIPDVQLQSGGNSNFLQSKELQKLIFNFANYYRSIVNNIPNLETFTFSDSDYDKFVQYANTQSFGYNSRSEIYLDSLRVAAESDNIPELLQKIDEFKKTIHASESQMLIKHKEQITPILQSEIIKRYSFSKGQIRNSFYSDSYVLKGISLIQDTELRTKILSN